ncbi:homoserine dehydrogenase [Trueperella sp. LYQ143]|uniref:homoserine dehydrogenase n=1 Tax=Trueperella sp. LYQ143 TaxID=3391059 RepID=UPI003983795F
MSVAIALLGCGTVGTEVARLLTQQRDILSARAGAELDLVGIAVSRLDAPRHPAIDRSLLTTDVDSLISRADIVIELIGGIEPPRTWVTQALRQGASVVTGNKALLAAHGPEIYELAKAHDVDVYYEAAVAGAVPVVYGLRESLAGDTVTRIQGILNGTTNYILDEMTRKALPFDQALAQAQSLGYAEADPSADVDGDDAAAKIAILASLAFHQRILRKDVTVQGIRSITSDDIAAAKELGYVIKLLATADRDPRTQAIDVRVCPTLVAHDHPLAGVHGSYNTVIIDSLAAGRLMFSGLGAGGAPTASAVLSDVVAAAAKKVHGGRAPQEIIYGESDLISPQESRSAFCVRICVTDTPGALAEIARAFADAGVSISSVRHDPDTRDGIVYITVMTHVARVCDLQSALAHLDVDERIQRVLQVMRVEEE